MAYLVFDIETVKDESIIGTWKPRDPAKDTFPPPIFWEPVAIGMLWIDGPIESPRMKLGMIGTSMGERERLEKFNAIIDVDEPPTLVTWNGRGFDLPVIVARSLKHGVPLAGYYRHKGMRYRYDDEGHFDIKDFLTDFGGSPTYGLDPTAKAMGLPGKMDVDGAGVAELYAAKKVAEIEAYCLQDVVHLGFVLMRTRLLQGNLTVEQYQRLAGALWSLAEKDRRVAAIVERADRASVFLEGRGAAPVQKPSSPTGPTEDWLV